MAQSVVIGLPCTVHVGSAIRIKVLAHWVRNFHMRFLGCFIFVILSYQNACYNSKTQKIEPGQKNIYDRRKFQRQCVIVIDTTWGRICFLTCKSFSWEFRTQCAKTFTDNSFRLFRVDSFFWETRTFGFTTFADRFHSHTDTWQLLSTVLWLCLFVWSS